MWNLARKIPFSCNENTSVGNVLISFVHFSSHNKFFLLIILLHCIPNELEHHIIVSFQLKSVKTTQTEDPQFQH